MPTFIHENYIHQKLCMMQVMTNSVSKMYDIVIISAPILTKTVQICRK